jgi:hypothetical protein
VTLRWTLQGRPAPERCAELGASTIRIELEHSYGLDLTRASPPCSASQWSLTLPSDFYRAKLVLNDAEGRPRSKPVEVSFEAVPRVATPVDVDFPASVMLAPAPGPPVITRGVTP